MKTLFALFCLLLTIPALSFAEPIPDLKIVINVSQPAHESFSIEASRSVVSAVKRDTEVQLDGKTVEEGYHIQITPNLSDPQPYLKIYLKSIIPSNLPPGYFVRVQTAKVPLTIGKKKWTGSFTAFDSSPVSMEFEVTELR